MNKKRDMFLTELIDKDHYKNIWVNTDKQGGSGDGYYQRIKKETINFSSSQGFFKLWNWMQEQEWFELFLQDTSVCGDCYFFEDSDVINRHLINPDQLANVFYVWYKSGQYRGGGVVSD